MPITLPINSKFDPTGINQALSGTDRLSGSLKNFGMAAGLAIAGAVAGLGAYAVSALKASDESNKIVRGLDNMISNTEAFGNSVESIKKASKTITDFTQEFALLTGISDETFNSLATSFLAAPEIAKMGADGVNRLIKISADAAAATGKDLESVGTALAKALENPETAMAKLQKANIFLTEEQKNTYQAMVDIGDIAGAQGYLIETLGQKYAGAAEAAASPWERLRETFEKLKEVVGNELGKALLPVIPLIQAAVEAMIADPAFAVMIAEVAKAFTDLAPSLIDLIPQLVELAMVLIPFLIQIIPVLIPLVSFLSDAFENMSPVLEDVSGSMSSIGGIAFRISPIIGGLTAAVGWLNKTFGEAGPAIAGIVSPLSGIIGFFMNLDSWIEKVVSGWNDFMALVTGKPLPSTMPNIVRSAGIAAGLRPMATGGIVMGPTPALVGEAGPEAIIPLDRLGKMGGNSYNINVTAGVGDPQVIGQQIVSYIKRYEKASGPVFAGA
jgi:hypothetical protein